MPTDYYTKLKQSLGKALFDKVKIAFLKAETAHKNQKRDNGEPYIVHPVRVSLILHDELKIQDPNSLIIALLHDVIEDTTLTANDLEQLFGQKISESVKKLTKPDNFKLDRDSQRKYYWHLKRAPKNIQLIKLSDRLDNLRDLQTCPNTDKIRRILFETDYIFVPWAKRINYYLAGEFEDLIFLYKEKLGDIKI